MLLAVPKKGRLYERVQGILKGSGLHHVRAARLDVAPCTKLPVTIVFLPAADIAKYVSDGNVDMGITGEDIIAESNAKVSATKLSATLHCRDRFKFELRFRPKVVPCLTRALFRSTSS